MQKVILALLLLLFGAPHTAFRAASEPVTVLGVTEWRCNRPNPDPWVGARIVLDNPNLATEVAEHEVMHEEQMLRHGNCLKYTIAMMGPRGRELGIEMEAEAFCASAKRASRNGTYSSLDAAIRKYSGNLMLYGFLITRDEAETRIRSYCTPKDL